MLNYEGANMLKVPVRMPSKKKIVIRFRAEPLPAIDWKKVICSSFTPCLLAVWDLHHQKLYAINQSFTHSPPPYRDHVPAFIPFISENDHSEKFKGSIGKFSPTVPEKMVWSMAESPSGSTGK